MNHGTGYAYACLGCRCDDCRAAQRAYPLKRFGQYPLSGGGA